MANLKNVNLMSQDTFNNIEQVDDELYAVSASGIGFPSSRYEDLTLGASGTKYTAPANGWFFLRKWSTKDTSYLELENKTSGIVCTHFKYGTTSMQDVCLCPVKKGDVVQTNYTFNGDTTVFRFIYAEGE